MKEIILAIVIFLMTVGIARAVEKIDDNCYKFDGILVCESEKITTPEITTVVPKTVEPIKNEEDVIVKTFWTVGNEN